jgi:hypothetical protein
MYQCSECHIAVDKLIPGLLILIFIPQFRDVEDLTRSILNLRPEIGVEVHERCGCGQGNYKTKKGVLPPPIVPVIRLPQVARSCGHGECRNPPNPQDRRSLAPGLQQRC